MESKSPITITPSPHMLIDFRRIVASLVRVRPAEFFFNIVRWLLVAVPATWTNSWLTYIQNKLSLAYRTRLTQHVMEQYLGGKGEGADGKVYYKLCGSTSNSDIPVSVLIPRS
jgi:ABC-type uncharacterized transport system fused permease/ATPase subunit